MSTKHTTPAKHKSNLRNVYGTFAIEGLKIGRASCRERVCLYV